MRKRRGNCYVTCEALYHLLGGPESDWTPHTVRHEGVVHWYLAKVYTMTVRYAGVPIDETRREILDPTASQFDTPPDYTSGRGRGFLTKGPSKRARALMEVLLWQPSPQR